MNRADIFGRFASDKEKRYLLVCQFVHPRCSSTNSQTSNHPLPPVVENVLAAGHQHILFTPTLHRPSPQCRRTYKGKAVWETVAGQAAHRLPSGLSPCPPREITPGSVVASATVSAPNPLSIT